MQIVQISVKFHFAMFQKPTKSHNKKEPININLVCPADGMIEIVILSTNWTNPVYNKTLHFFTHGNILINFTFLVSNFEFEFQYCSLSTLMRCCICNDREIIRCGKQQFLIRNTTTTYQPNQPLNKVSVFKWILRKERRRFLHCFTFYLF